MPAPRILPLAAMVAMAWSAQAYGQEKPPTAKPEAVKTAPAQPEASKPAASKSDAKTDKPIEKTLPQPATTVEPPPLPSADVINPERFGAKPADAAYGAFQRGLYRTAYNLALPRAQNGDPAAATLLAEITSRGLGVPLNFPEAAKWYAQAAERGVPEAQFQYALMLIEGRYVKKDEKGAFALMQAAAEAGNRLAQFNFAQLLVQQDTGDDGLAKAVPYYERAAATGLADAQYAMAQIFANGVGGKKQDDARARRLLEQAARQNYDTAQLDLAQWMVDGRGGKRDLAGGFGWMKRAADGGNVAARNRLAKFYMAGIGVDPDSNLAAAWYIVARRAGLIDQDMEDFLRGLTTEEIKKALQQANRLP